MVKIMSVIKTYTGVLIDPLKPEADLIRIEDIAHALSMLCRANGHFKTFYSVAQHSINCMKEAAARGYSKRLQLACLLHDGSEAYLADITRPVKSELPKYKEIEEPLQALIWNKWLIDPLTAEEEVQALNAHLKQGIRVVVSEGEIDLKEAASYLSVHKPMMRLRDYEEAENKEILLKENGKLILKEN
jgi:5'-deoxynucleotidase YfbR-like HD superfamily hydrolase